MNCFLNVPQAFKMFLSLPPYFKALPLIIICTIFLTFIFSYQSIYHQKEENSANKNNHLSSKLMDNNEYEKILKPVKILVIAFPR